MKYSLRSLMLDALIAVPYLVFFAVLLWCGRELLAYYDEYRFLHGLSRDYFLSDYAP